MPSAGLLAFSRSFICTFNNTCHAKAENAKNNPKFFAYDDAFINEIVEDVETALENNFDEENVEALTDIVDDFSALQNVYSSVSRKLTSGSAIDGLTVTKVRSLLKDPDEFRRNLIEFGVNRNITFNQDEINAFLEVSRTSNNYAPSG